MQKFTFLKFWFLLGLVTTAMSGLVYLTVQQNLRQSANDPQIQMAEDTATLLWYGHNPTDILPTNVPIDMSLTLAPFVIITDNTGYILGTTGYLGGGVPLPPQGVFDYVRAYGEDRITWQPRSDTRIATVVTRYGNASSSTNGFVIAGRSLKEVEKREGQLIFMVFLAWFATIITTLVVALALHKYEIYKSK